jgi:hypothetical protein
MGFYDSRSYTLLVMQVSLHEGDTTTTTIHISNLYV